MKCKICRRDAQKNGFCMMHLKAYQNIIGKFDVWKEATDATWSQYLFDIQKNSLTGEWAKEVAQYVIKEENRNVK